MTEPQYQFICWFTDRSLNTEQLQDKYISLLRTSLMLDRCYKVSVTKITEGKRRGICLVSNDTSDLAEAVWRYFAVEFDPEKKNETTFDEISHEQAAANMRKPSRRMLQWGESFRKFVAHL